jgi:hypothetical protein
LEVVSSSIPLEEVAASIQMETVVATTSEAVRLRETLSTASRVLAPYEKPVIHQSMGSSDRGVYWDADRMGRGLRTQIMLIIYYQIELDKLNIYKALTCSISKMC